MVRLSLTPLLRLFQSTLPRGSDVDGITPDEAGNVFQSTLPRGSDSVSKQTNEVENPFQSTLPRGSDNKNLGYTISVPISIHAPSRERLL